MSDKSNNKLTSKRKAVPVTRLLELREAGLTFEDIGQVVGLSKQAVWDRLKAIKVDFKGLAVFKDRRADILALVQQRLLYSLTDKDIKSMPGGSRILALCQLYDKERIERGQPGAYIQYSDFDVELETVNSEIKQLEAELADLG